MHYLDHPSVRDILPGIRSRADGYDQSGDWPIEDLRALADAGGLRWSIPASFGGEDLSSIELHFRYETIASASLSTALIISQRDSAIAWLDASTNAALREELLTKLARNEFFATVGIAQLTTSRQGGIPALRATLIGNQWHLDGIAPWASGADQSAYVVVGATVEVAGAERQQILVALPTNLAGVRISPPLPLVALRSTHTGTIHCEKVMIEPSLVINGPTLNALASRKRTIPLGQAFLAMGLCVAGINLIEAHDSDMARQTASRFESQLAKLRTQVLDACNPAANDPAVIPVLRGQVNNLAIRITHAAVAIYKGSALLIDHPAQRLAREAMFLLVWSCPSPVIDCTVELLRGQD